MADIADTRATYADLEAVPPHLVAEILRGRLVTHPRPAPPHAEVHFSLGGVLSGPFRNGIGGPGGWRFLTEPELHLGEDVAVPELAAWRIERMPELPETAFIELPPDWVCEVLSPSTEKYDRGDKREIYAEAGVRHLWLIDPRVEVLEVFALKDARWSLMRTYTGASAVRAAPFDAMEFPLSLLWPLGPGAADKAR